MPRLMEVIDRIVFRLLNRRAFESIGQSSHIVRPFRLDGADGMTVGARTFLQRGAWLYCRGVDGIPASLRIGNDCVFGYNNHITAVRDVVIGDFVLTANNVFIADNVHSYEDVHTPIINQPVRFRKAVSIGAGSWLGENACIVGASIGRNCVVSANAVVTRDVPDYCVVAGIPATIIKQYDATTKTWRRPSAP